MSNLLSGFGGNLPPRKKDHSFTQLAGDLPGGATFLAPPERGEREVHTPHKYAIIYILKITYT